MTTQTTPPTYKPRTLPFVILGILLVATAVFITERWMSQVKPPRPRSVVEHLPRVTLQAVNPSTHTADFSAGGFVSAKYSSRLTAQVSGQVLTLSPHFVVGKHVKKGEVLATIEAKNYVAALANAKANVANAKSNYAQEQARARQAKRDAKRLNLKANRLLLRQPQLAAAKAAIANAEAQLTLAKQNLADTAVKAPFAAIVQSRHIAVGDGVMVNTAVGQLVNTEVVTVKLTLDSALFNLITLGSPVTLNNPMTGATYSAQIHRFDPAVNQTTRTVGVYVDISQPFAAEKPLLLNTYLHAKVTSKPLSNTLWVDNPATVNNQFVWTIDAEEKLQKVPFTLFYRGKTRSLVQLKRAVSHFISNPRDSFFVGEKVLVNPQPAINTTTNKGQQGE